MFPQTLCEGKGMQSARHIALCWALLSFIAVSGNSYAASRDSRATLHISVTLVSTIATGPTEPVERSQVASSENQGIIYNLRPDPEQNVGERVISSQPKGANEQSPTSASSCALTAWPIASDYFGDEVDIAFNCRKHCAASPKDWKA